MRNKLFQNKISPEELLSILQKPNWESTLELQGDDWRDWVESYDWANLGPSLLANAVFETMEVSEGIENLHYFGIAEPLISIISNELFSAENLKILTDLLTDVGLDLDEYGNFFLDTSDEDLNQEWLKTYDKAIEILEDEAQLKDLISARKELSKFFKDEF